MTTTGQFVGSLPWASPEQAQGRSDALDIRTDVYSLGVIFYQLLTGEFPYPISGPLNEVVGHIVESDPVRPSTIERDIDRELETILLKCLAKEPERRYQSAGEVARDIRRYLAGEAIEARRESLVYLMRKRLARYRVAALGAAAMLVVVLSALIISIVSWNQAARQRTIAEKNESAARESAAQARAVTDFMREIMTSVEPENQGADVRLIEVLEKASAEASRRFARHPQQEAQVRDLFGQVYDTLTMWTEAIAEYARAEDLWRESAGGGPDDPRTLDTQGRRALAMINIARTDEAERVLGDLVPRLERLYGRDDPRTLRVYRKVALTHLLRGRQDEAQQLLLHLRAHPRLADDDEAQIGVVNGLLNLHIRNTTTFDEAQIRASLLQAESLAQELVERAMRFYGPDSVKALHSRCIWADIACRVGRFQAAADTCRDILDDSIGRLGACHFVRMSAMYVLAEALAGLGEHIEPADLLRQRIECLRAQTAPNSVGILSTLSGALPYFERAGRAAEGEAVARELSAGLAQYGGGHGEMALVAEQYLAHFVSMQNRLDEAGPMFRGLLEREDQLREAPPGHARLHLFHGLHLARRGQFEQAEAELKRAVELIGDIHSGTWGSHPDDIVLGFIALYEAWGKPEELQKYQRMRDEMLRTRRTP
jgi:tetratricopeptide (TPR) repeat protein